MSIHYWFAEGVRDFNDDLPRIPPRILLLAGDHEALIQAWLRGWDHAQFNFGRTWNDS